MYIQKSYKDDNLKLYVIPTPIGNLEDITIRALNVLKELDILYCEDTRVTKKLLNYYNIDVKLITYNEYTDSKVNEKILENLQANLKVGLVSDAGMPLISDPGFKLLRFLKESNVNIIILPGATAFVEPMVYFCANNNPYIFKGFLSKNKRTYEEDIRNITHENNNVVIYETPHRIEKTLELINFENLNNEILIAREISKIYENYIQGSVGEVLEYVKSNPLKGEIVLIIGEPKIVEDKVNYLEETKKLIEQGVSLKIATKEVAMKYNISKNKLYNEYLTHMND